MEATEKRSAQQPLTAICNHNRDSVILQLGKRRLPQSMRQRFPGISINSLNYQEIAYIELNSEQAAFGLFTVKS
ncbi:MAG TPA: hypothetical protein DDW78_07745 [Treponema sp.]|nr:hypothetical protein [Treponema sp.]